MTEPERVRRLAQERAAARSARDFARADALRDELAALGWLVTDTPEGFALAEKPPYDVAADLRSLPDRSGEPAGRDVAVHLLVEGWPDDLRACLDALLEHTSAPVVALATADAGDAAGVLHEYADAHPGRVAEHHVGVTAGWSAARTALTRLDASRVQVWMETSTVLEGDAVTPLVDALDADGVVGAAWRGVDVDLADDWRSFVDHPGGGECDALLGYLVAWDRAALLASGGPDPKARFYRNADIELSLALREAAGRLLCLPDLPARQERHRGYHDSDPEVRDRESRRTYDRILRRFRGRPDILAPRAGR